ncbi:amidohydrolase 2 [Citreicella sp. SE45]|nr:amidohydrolase 2 [Citreicella sp. SE45]
MQLDGSEGAAELDRLHGLGVRGVRINQHGTSANDIAAATARISGPRCRSLVSICSGHGPQDRAAPANASRLIGS